MLNRRLLARELGNFDFPGGEKRDKINKIIIGWQIALKDYNLNKTKEKEIQGQFLSNRQSKLDLLVKDTSKSEEEISKAFYNDFKELRIKLFNHIKEHNSRIESRLLIEKVQKLLDRMVFIFFCEDTNNLLPHNIFQQVYNLGIKSRERSDMRVWREFKNLFQDIDEGRYDIDPPINAYNGGLFRFDEQLNDLNIKDDIWADVIKISEYDFESDLNVNILGHIFEQSLSDLEQLKAEIDGVKQDKSRSKRKKDGIFYTPEYITRYIVEQTVGKCLEENPDKLETIKILDPACGSGAFLNQAHSFLKEQYRIGYEEGRVKSKDSGFGALFDYNPAENDRSILLNNLFGVDLIEESVEITKLALWLKTAHKGYPLQNLNENIKCGNSLVDTVEIAGDKAFLWKNEFAEIINNGGFDVIIGNPPYGAALDEAFKNYIYHRYEAIEYQIDTYVVFMQKAFELLKDNGRLSFIVPSTWLSMSFFQKIRNFFISQTKLEKVVLFRYQVFEDVVAETCIFVCKKTSDNSSEIDIAVAGSTEKMLKLPYSQISQNYWKTNYENGFNVFYGQDRVNLIEKLFKEKYKLKDLADITVGVKPYQIGKGAPKQTKEDVEKRIYDANIKIDELHKPYLTGSNIFKYCIVNPKGRWLKYGNWLAEPRKTFDFSKDKIVIRQTSDKIVCAVDKNGYLSLNNVHNLLAKEKINLDYLTTVLNSRLIDFIYKYLAPETGRVFAEVKVVNLEKLPFPNAILEQQESLANKAAEMMELNKTLREQKRKALELLQAECKPKKISQKLEKFYALDASELFEELAKQGAKPSLKQKEEILAWHGEKSNMLNTIQQKILTLDGVIDQEIYALYNLTSEEIAIVEEG